MKESRREESLRVDLDPEVRYTEVLDERSEVGRRALELIRRTFPRQDRHSIDELRSELEEKRRNLLSPYDFHLLAMVDSRAEVVAVAAGVYLAGVNCGFVDYLAVDESFRRQRLGHVLRAHLLECFRASARASGQARLAWILGEVRLDSPWLLDLVRNGAVPFDLTYYHPGMASGESEDRYVLYREPEADRRRELPTDEVRRILYAIYRRAYRVRYPLLRENFRAMLEEIEGRESVGEHPEVIRRMGETG